MIVLEALVSFFSLAKCPTPAALKREKSKQRLLSIYKELNEFSIRKIFNPCQMMDRRKFKLRRGLHQNFMNPSTSATPSPVPDNPESEDMFSSSHRSGTSSQRVSSLELLRKRTQTPTLLPPKESAKTEQSQAKRKKTRPLQDSPTKISQKDPKPSQNPEKRRETFPRPSTSKSSTTLSSQLPEKESRSENMSLRLPKPSQIPVKSSTQRQTDSDKGNDTKLRNKRSRMIFDDSSDEETVIQKEKSLLAKFFEESGIKKLLESDEQYTITTNPAGIVKNIQQVLSSGSITKNNLIKEWQSSIEQVENIKMYLNPTIVDHEHRVLGSASNVSLARILLQVPLIQSEILSSLLKRLNEEVLLADTSDDVSWAYTLLPQLRFLEFIADADSMTARLEELLETSPNWFKRELIAYLPDIVTDSHHQTIADMLCKLMESDGQLKQVILDCITSLTLGKEYLEELRDKVLVILQHNNEISEIPALVKFCLYDCPSIEICQKVLRVVREVEMRPLRDTNFEECYTSQMLTANALKMSLKTTSKAVVAILSESHDSSPKALDLIMLLLLCSDGSKKKVADGILKKHIKSGYYRASLLNLFYRDFKQVAKDLQMISLNLSSSLLKSEDCTLVDFSTEWFKCQFLLHDNLYHKQSEIIGKLILLMGNDDQTAKNSLAVLCKMTENDEDKIQLQKHCNELTVLMEKIDKFDLEEVGTMNDLLYALCNTSDSSSEALRDDLFILLQKQLTNTDSIIKCKGVVSAVMAIKHLAQHNNSCKLAHEILMKIEVSVKDCLRARVLFYDKMSQIIHNNESINEEFVKNLTGSFEDELANSYMTDTEYRGDLIQSYGLNSPDYAEPMMIHFGETKYGAIVSALFRMIRIGYMRTTADHSLVAVSAVLGSGIMMPRDMVLPEPRTLDLLFHCVNWLRELISAFITQSDDLLKKQVVQRLDNLMNLQGELCNTLAVAETRYQPPPCYFHRYPPPPFVRIVEKKPGKKSGKKKKEADKTNTTSSLPEWAAWENGSLMTMKNPMYFRRLDATIVIFLDTDVSRDLSSGHVCFVVKEVLSMLEDNSIANPVFIKDLVKLLPKICARLNHIVSELRNNDNNQDKQAVRLILSLLSTLFSWKGFNSVSHFGTLRDGLRTLASQMDPSKGTLRSSSELVTESYLYFESLADIATQIPIAHGLVGMCKTLMTHSETYTEAHKDKQAKMAYGFLCLEWPDDRHMGNPYKLAVTGLLKNWLDHEPDPLQTVSEVLEWLPEEAEKLEKPQDRLSKLPTIHRANFHYFFQKLFDGLIKGCKISLATANGDTAKLQVWRQVAKNVQLMVKVCKTVPTRGILLSYLRQIPNLLKLLLNVGMPVLEHNLRYQTEDVTGILKMMQAGTRYLNAVSVHSTERRDMALTKLVPAAKTILEQLLYRVKGMLVMNNSATAFWMGNLVNKNLDGQEILSQSSISTDEPIIPEDTAENHNSSGDESLSDILEEDEEIQDNTSVES